MNTITGGLLARLEGFEIDEPGASLPFTARLARENGWTLAFAGRVVREYKRFVFLSAAAGHPVTPPEQVDQAWHLHMIYTRSYWERMCGEILGRPLHHDPTQGGAAEGAKFHDWYARTLESYRRHFAESPPPDIWPPAHVRFQHAGRMRWVDCARAIVIPLPFAVPRLKFSLPLVLCALVSVIALFLPSCSLRGDSGLPLDWKGGAFLLLYGALYAAMIPLVLAIKRRFTSRFERPGEPEPLTDACEIAFLSGGGKRVMQAAIARLVSAGALEVLQTRWLRKVKLRATGTVPEPQQPIERSILSAASNSEGVPMAELLTTGSHHLKVIESRLASRGLKPTASERAVAGCAMWLPIVVLMIFGISKVVIGTARHKPVGFLVAFLFVTFITGIILSAKIKYLTPSGERMLESLRSRRKSEGTPRGTADELAVSVALFGLPVLAGLDGMDPVYRELKSAHSASSGDSGGGGCGSSGCSSSGCGSSGCGSSGCGGCGGGD